jgi:hypothetical protein
MTASDLETKKITIISLGYVACRWRWSSANSSTRSTSTSTLGAFSRLH